VVLRCGLFVWRLPSLRGLKGSPDPQIFRRVFSAIVHDVEADLGPLCQGRVTSLLNRRNMDEDILAPVVGLNKSITLRRIKPLHSPRSHLTSPFFKNQKLVQEFRQNKGWPGATARGGLKARRLRRIIALLRRPCRAYRPDPFSKAAPEAPAQHRSARGHCRRRMPGFRRWPSRSDQPIVETAARCH
jgi:hypothetical protein